MLRASGADDVAGLGLESRKLRFLMIANILILPHPIANGSPDVLSKFG